MNKLACRAAATLLMIALASCGGGGSGGESSIGLPAGQSPSSQSISDSVATPAVAAKAELQDPSGVQGLSAAQADSSGGVAALRGQGVDALSERAQMRGVVTDSGSVSARFVPSGHPERYDNYYYEGGGRPYYLLVGSGPAASNTYMSFKPITQSEQAANGAMVRLNDTTLTGNRVTQNINGDANFAIGRWVSGTVTQDSGKTTVLTGDYKGTYHYLGFRALSDYPGLPPDGTLPFTCNDGVFTTPSYLDSGSSSTPLNGTVTGSATISFDTQRAHVAGEIKVMTGNEAGTVPIRFSTLANSPSAGMTAFSLEDKTVVSYMLGDDEARGSLTIAIAYIAVMRPSRARYTGVARLSCRPTP